MTPTLHDLLRRIALEYDVAEHTPYNPTVMRAYDAFKAQLLQQYQQIPYRVLFVDENPYATSADMFRIVEQSGILQVYTGSDLPDDHPMSDIVSHNIIPHGISYNLVFRAVHDALIHIPYRLSFGPVGEFKAFQQHAWLITESVPVTDTYWHKPAHVVAYGGILAQPIRALATETLAQSAWFNTIGEGKTFAPQKACLLPDSLIVEALEYRV